MKQSCSFQNLHVINQFYSFSYLYVLVLTNQKTFSVRSHVRSHGRFDVISHGRFDVISHGRFDVISHGRFDVISHGRFDVISHGRSHGRFDVRSSIKHQTREYNTHSSLHMQYSEHILCKNEMFTRRTLCSIDNGKRILLVLQSKP